MWNVHVRAIAQQFLCYFDRGPIFLVHFHLEVVISSEALYVTHWSVSSVFPDDQIAKSGSGLFVSDVGGLCSENGDWIERWPIEYLMYSRNVGFRYYWLLWNEKILKINDVSSLSCIVENVWYESKDIEIIFDTFCQDCNIIFD